MKDRLSLKSRFARQLFLVYVVLFFSVGRLWGFFMKKNANLEQDLDSLPLLALLFRVIPISLIFVFLIYKDLKRNFNGFKSFFSNITLFSGFLFIVISIFSGYMKSQSLFSVWKSIELLAVLYVTSSLYSLKLNEEQSTIFIRKIFNFFKFLLVLTGISALIFPQYGFHPKIIQLFSVFPKMNPNALGTFALVTLSYCVYIFNKERKDLVFIIYIFSIYILALSRTAYVSGLLILSLVFGQMILKFAFKKKVIKLTVAIYSIAIILITALLPFSSDQISKYVTKGQSTEQLSTMSSRTMIWTAAWLSIKESPLLGYGLFAETKKLNLRHKEIFKDSRKKDRGVSNTHNSYVDILLASGFIGGGLYILTFLINFFRSILHILLSRKLHLTFVFCAIIIAYFFRFFTGGGYAGLAFESMTYFLLIALRLLPWKKKIIEYEG
jgi:O-antigen ligase